MAGYRAEELGALMESGPQQALPARTTEQRSVPVSRSHYGHGAERRPQREGRQVAAKALGSQLTAFAASLLMPVFTFNSNKIWLSLHAQGENWQILLGES